SAELRPHQTDQDSLPPYDVLDEILKCLIEKEEGLAEIVARGLDVPLVKKVWALLDRAEYKRRQSPPGPKVTNRHLSRDRHYPITNRYVDEN
ncbi:MAG: NAD+ synthase, partial [Alphaproteobacteria bacterium]|nr:NAD+ synthase [Alphaproteobacteria bacterium]